MQYYIQFTRANTCVHKQGKQCIPCFKKAMSEVLHVSEEEFDKEIWNHRLYQDEDHNIRTFAVYRDHPEEAVQVHRGPQRVARETE